MRIPDYTVSQFLGLNTFIKDTKTLKPGVASDSLNWVTAKFGDHIELRRGTALLGQTRTPGAGKITGLGVAIRYDGTQIPYWSRARKIEYYDATTDDRIEVGSDLLPAAASGEDVWFAPYQNLAGSFMYCGSPNSGVYKIPAANPGSAVDQQVNNFRFGVFNFSQGRSRAGQRNGTTAGNNDKTGLYWSAIDKALLGSFTQTTGEPYGTGDGVTKTFAHTLAVVSGKKTCMYPSVTDTVETFTDDRNGTMVGSLGGTGTINYATGAVSVTFITAPVNLQAITCSYYTEDATSGGVLDFDTSVTGAGKAKIFRQDDGGGAFQNIIDFQSVSYGLHLLRTWATTQTLDDTSSTNLPYRNIGIAYPLSASAAPEGILLIDTSNPTDPKVRRLEIQQNTTNLTIVPTPISDAIDLSGYAFAYGVAKRWGEYELISIQAYVNGVANLFNSVTFIRNVTSGAWDRLDYRISCAETYNGSLIAGDPLSANVFTLFSGFDDDDLPITNYWQDGQLNLGTMNLKRAHFMRVTGLIQKDQDIQVSLIMDDGTPVSAFLIQGDGSYVDQGINTPIGSYTIGSKVIGGGGEATAHPFDVTFPIHTDVFQYVSVKFEAQGIGYAEIDSYTYRDIRDKGRRSLPTKIASS
jgi:hypothetical protein